MEIHPHILDLCTDKIDKFYTTEDSKNKYTRIDLFQYNLKPCRGCRICLDISEAKCPQNDNVISIIDMIKNADCIIVGSPVYVEDISGTMKNFIDRMAFNCHRPFLNGNPVYLFTTSASVASIHALKTLRNAFLSWGGSIVGYDNYRMGSKMDVQLIENHFGSLITRRINLLVDFYLKDKVTLYGLISFTIQKRYWGKRKGTIDYNYWIKMNWLNRKCIYYRNINVSFLKKLIAILVSNLAILFMS